MLGTYPLGRGATYGRNEYRVAEVCSRCGFPSPHQPGTRLLVAVALRRVPCRVRDGLGTALCGPNQGNISRHSVLESP